MSKELVKIQQILKKEKPFLAEKYGVKEISVFGSYVRGEEREDSDLDILVEFEKPLRIDLIGFIEVENYLSDILDIKVDLVMKDDLKPRIGERILTEMVPV